MKKTLFLLSLVFFPMLLAAAPEFEEDLHYSAVIPSQPGGEGGRVQVMEFFLYGCSHCYQLESHIKEWLKTKPEYVDFVKVPVMSSRPDVALYTKTFYALELMGISGEIHEKIFYAIHEERRDLGTREKMEQFLDKQGIDLAAYRNAMGSFAVQTQARRAGVLSRRFGVRSVPAMAVDGKYITGGLNGTTMMQVVDYLVEKTRKEKAPRAAEAPPAAQ
jgi:thiol:disulfide interchange protein DsbA